MSRRFLLAISFVLVATTAAFAPSSHAAEPAKQPAPALAQHITEGMRRTKVPGLAIAKIEDGNVAWVEVFGERAPGVPLTRETVFNVASLTKPVFAMLTLQMAAEGKLWLDEPLAPHWVDPDIAGDARRFALTPRLVLSHQTGFQNWRGSGKLAFAFVPGTHDEYSGEGYEYLRKAIEHQTGQPMRELMRSRVLAKAGMTSTSFGWNDAFKDRVATGYDAFANPYKTDLAERQPNAAASMFTTIDDYAHFAAWVSRGADLPRALFDEMRRPQAQHADPAESFGLGWRLVQVGDETVLAHDGRENGVRTQVFVLPATREGLVVLTSSDNGELLVRPIVEATLTRGPQLMNQIAKDTWSYLGKQPGSRLEPLMQDIARSPSFMAKMMQAADATLLTQADLGDEERREVRATMGRFPLDMLDGRVEFATALRVAQMLLESGDGGPRLRTRMAREDVRAWVKIMVTTEAQAGPSADIKVPDDVLASYVGSYLVPSSKLVVVVTREGDSLQATAKGMPVIRLHPESQTRFYMKEDATRFEFVRNDKQAVTGLTLLWSGGRSEYARKVE